MIRLNLPDFLLFGYWGSAPFPWLLILAKSHKDNAGLIAHEQCHQDQQRRHGWFKWVRRYLFNRSWRLSFEVEAYKAWIKVQPQDFNQCCYVLVNSYGFGLSMQEARELLSN